MLVATPPPEPSLPSAADSLDVARRSARSGVHWARNLERAAVALDGLPVGGWPETRQAITEIEGALPTERAYTVTQWIDAAYTVELADQSSSGIYRSRLVQEADRQRADQLYAIASRLADEIAGETITLTRGEQTCTVEIARDGTITRSSPDLSGHALARACPEFLARALRLRTAVLDAQAAYRR